jgi:shikimate kinase
MDTPFDVCLSRIRGEEGRPLSKKSDKELEQLYLQRLPLYESSNFRRSQWPKELNFSDLRRKIVGSA